MKLFLTVLCLFTSSVIFAQNSLNFDVLGNYHNGYAFVKTGNQLGFINSKGKLVGKLFDSNKVSYDTYKSGMQGNGTYIIQNGHNRYGIKAVEGNVILEPIHNRISFVNGFFVVLDRKGFGTRNYQVISPTGKIFYNSVIDNIVSDAFSTNDEILLPISENLIAIMDVSKKKGKYALKTMNNHKLTPFQYTNIKTLENGLIKAEKYIENEGKKKWGFINEKGIEVIDFKYTNEPSSFSDSLAIVKSLKKKYGYIDMKGNVVIPAQYIEASKFINGIAVVRIYYSKLINKKRNHGYRLIDKKGNILFDFGSMSPVSNNKYDIIEENKLVRVIVNSKRAILNIYTHSVIETNYYKIEKFNSGLALVKSTNKTETIYGFINEKGILVSSTEKEDQF